MIYQGSQAQLANLAVAQVKALERHQELKQTRINKYYSIPKRCLQCDAPIPYEKQREAKFCSRTCSGKHNSPGRRHHSATKDKIAESLLGKPSPLKGRVGNQLICRVYFKNCPVCQRIFYTHGKGEKWSRKTCSRECGIIASTANRPYQNGSRKNIRFYNEHQQKEILLESSWELKVAYHLDDLKIQWIRPKPVRWIDAMKVSRMYYPDFYLPDHQLYLDPKNPWCLMKDAEKLDKVCRIIRLEYGSLEHIFEVINELV